MKKIYTSFIFCSLVFSQAAFTQPVLDREVVASAGDDAVTAEGFRFSWTLGETAIETLTGNGLILTQGFHQNEGIVSPVIEIEEPGLLIEIFPNPVAGELVVRRSGSFRSFQVDLFDLNGRRLEGFELEAPSRRIDLSRLPSAVYLLRFSNESGILQTVRIVKIQDP